MNDAKHTPGPWENTTFSAGSILIASPTYGAICKINLQGVSAGVRNEHEANARLIAAAPELAEALIQLLEDIDEFEIDVNRRFYSAAKDEARAALRKAGIFELENTEV